IETFPDRPLFGMKKGGVWQWSTYLEFGRNVDKLRAGLAALGFSRGDRIACIANNRVEWAEMAYACFGLGVAFVPMYEAMLPKDWEFIVKDCDAKGLVVATEDICEKTKGFFESTPALKQIISLDPKTKGTDRIKTYKSLLDGKAP